MTIPTCNVLCCINDDSGIPVVGASVSAKLNRTEVYNGFVIPSLVEGITDEQGKVTLALWPNEIGSTESMYAVKIISPDGKRISVNAVVPNKQTAQLHLISEVPPYEGKTDGQLILTEAVAASSAAISSAASARASQTAAAESETNAASSADSALASKDAAATSATNAANSATSALLSKDAAATSASQAAAYAFSAQTSAATASDKATQASVYASTASARASESATSANTSSTNATNAINAASSAATSATTATTQANMASNSASQAAASSTSAANSAINAANSATAAQNSYLALTADFSSHTTATNNPHQVTKAQVGLGSVNNTSDADKPVSTATQTALAGKSNTGHTHAIADVTNLQTALDAKAPLASPALTGTPTVPTATAGTNTTQAASTAFVQTAVANLVASAPAALDTLNELATALGNDANFATTMTNALAGKLNASQATAAGLALLGAADVAAQRSALGLANHDKITVTSGANIGVAVSPSSWGSIIRVLEFGNGTHFGAQTDQNPVVYVGTNAYYSSSGWKYKSSDRAMRYEAWSLGHCWLVAPSGVADAAVTFTRAMTLNAAGRLLLGTTTDDGVNLFQCAGSGKFAGGITTGGAIRSRAQGSRSSLGFKIDNTDGSETWLQPNLVGHYWTGSQDALSLRVPSNSSSATASYDIYADGSHFWKKTDGSTAGMLDASGNLIQTVNTTAATLTTNNTMTASIVNDTTLKFSVRGLDGVTRSATVSLA